MDNSDLRVIHEQWPDLDSLTREQVHGFLRSCSASAPGHVRNPGASSARRDSKAKALDLLLHPANEELPGYYLRLARYLAASRTRIADLPLELMQVFFELIGSAGKLPEDEVLRGFLEECIAKAPAPILPWLFTQRFTAIPFWDQLGQRLIPRGERFGEARGKWRVLGRLMSEKDSPARRASSHSPCPFHKGRSVEQHFTGGSVSLAGTPASPPGATGIEQHPAGDTSLGVLSPAIPESQPTAHSAVPVPASEGAGAARHFSGFRASQRTLNLKFERDPARLDSLEITLADMEQILRPGGAPARFRSGGPKPAGFLTGRRRHSQFRLWSMLSSLPAIRLREVKTPSRAFSNFSWGGGGKRKLLFLERLARAQAIESAEIGRFAEQASTQSGRVVLSWHNASLCSVGGWTFEDFARRFPSPALFGNFMDSVNRTADEIRNSLDLPAANRLFAMRAKRIFSPLAAQALSQIHALRSYDPELKAEWHKQSRMAAALLSSTEIEEIASGEKSEWTGAPATHQRVDLERVVAWSREAQETWIPGLCLMLALAIRGQEALDSGLIKSLVLPWIDKFFISSKRRADRNYLESLFQLIGNSIRDPLVLFWEDTAHARLPSFGLALEEMVRGGLPFRGIGVFDSAGSSRLDAAKIIEEDYPEKHLFALRPLNDNHFPEISRIFRNYQYDFSGRYDSSWKDNLVFLYCGTQAFRLLSPQTEMEMIPPWVSDGQHRFPFGTWLRSWLRTEILGRSGSRDPLWRVYSTWANLR